MYAKIIRLRKNGVLLDIPLRRTIEEFPPEAIVDGLMDFGKPMNLSGRSRCLHVRHAQSSPGMGVICELYQPNITDVQNTYFKVRGYEPVDAKGVTASHMQEWLVFPR